MILTAADTVVSGVTVMGSRTMMFSTVVGSVTRNSSTPDSASLKKAPTPRRSRSEIMPTSLPLLFSTGR